MKICKGTIILAIHTIFFLLFAGDNFGADRNGLREEFLELLEKEINNFPSFDIKAAEEEAVKELGLEKIPEKPPAGRSLNKLISKQAKQAAKKKFPEKKRSKLILEAMRKFKAWELGDELWTEYDELF